MREKKIDNITKRARFYYNKIANQHLCLRFPCTININNLLNQISSIKINSKNHKRIQRKKSKHKNSKHYKHKHY